MSGLSILIQFPDCPALDTGRTQAMCCWFDFGGLAVAVISINLCTLVNKANNTKFTVCGDRTRELVGYKTSIAIIFGDSNGKRNNNMDNWGGSPGGGHRL